MASSFITIAVIATILVPAAGCACSKSDVIKQFCQANAVVRGVPHYKERIFTEGWVLTDYMYHVRIDIAYSLVVPLKHATEVTVFVPAGDCEYQMEIGKEYVINLRHNGNGCNRFETDACMGSRLWSDVLEEEKQRYEDWIYPNYC